MMYYRLCLRHPVTGRITGFEQIETNSDKEAIDAVEKWRLTVPAELWCMSRKVHRWEMPIQTPPSGRAQDHRGSA